ncbi:MAG TPA: PKD domain-containing protein [Candidatus Lokiarchaeia archaeon]|nr:PKD domain-containing protein [Candidatus Lokiarchaeia archaeon]
MKRNFEKSIRNGIVIAAMVLFFVSILGSAFTKLPTANSYIEQNVALQAPRSNGISISNYVEDFNNWTNGQTITGEASGEHVHWVLNSSGSPTFKGTSTVISSGNSGLLTDASSGASIVATAVYDAPSPQTPSAANQYWQAVDVKITSGSLSSVNVNQAQTSDNVVISFAANGSLTVQTPSKLIGTGLTWSLNTKYTLVVQCLSASTSRFSLDGGNTWTQAFLDFHNFTGPVTQMHYYTGAALTVTAYFDNIATSWTQTIPTPDASFTMNSTSIQVNTTLKTTHTGSNGAGSCVYQWNFGDPGNATNCTTENGAHVYNTIGTYPVTLWMQDANGSTSKQSATILVGFIVEDFNNWTNGQEITGQANGQLVSWILNSSGTPTFLGSSRVISSRNSGQLVDSSSVYSIVATAVYDTPTPQIPSATNQYWQAVDIEITAGSLSAVYMNQAHTSDNMVVCFAANGSLVVDIAGNTKHWGTGLTWSYNTKYTLVMQCLSASTARFSLDGGKTWTGPFPDNNEFTGPVTEMHFYTGAALTVTAYFDNIVTSWAQSPLPAGMLPQGTIIIIFIFVIGGAVVGVSVGTTYQVRMKRLRAGPARSKKSDASYSQVSSASIDSSVAAFNKRERLMQINQDMVESPKKAKLTASTEPEIDFNARAASARDMESQVNVMPVMAKCVVHKGPITGFSYTCKNCGVPYCMDCYNHLIATSEKCWNCGQPLEQQTDATVTKQEVTLFTTEVWNKIEALNLSDEIKDEIIEQLKYIPPGQRIQYLNETFGELNDSDDW